MRTLGPRAWRATHASAPFNVGTSEGRLTAELRLALALITVMLAAGDSTAHPLLLPTAVGYLAYSAVVYVAGIEFQQDGFASLAQYYPVDAGAFLLFLSLADARGTLASLFAIYLFVFAVSGAAITWGVGTGLRLTAGTVGLFAAVIPVRASLANDLPVTETLLTLGGLLGAGAIAARRGGHQFTVRSRLILLRDAGTLSNPRFGADRTIDALLERLREFYDADTCLLTIRSDHSAEATSPHRADRYQTRKKAPAAPLSLDALPHLPHTTLAVYRRPRRWLPGPARVWLGERINGRVFDRRLPDHLAEITEWLHQVGGRSWLSVPAHVDEYGIGRLHMVGKRAFRPSDAKFVLQVLENGMRLVEHIRLIDQLASSAALQERQRVARDLHDSVVQPYVGLQLGLVAVQRILRSGDLVTAEARVRQLIDLTGMTIDELRSGIHGLKSEPGHSTDDLLGALHHHATRFAEDTGIPVEIDGIDTLQCGDRLAAELYQMTVEALSNVRRHTTATHAAVRFKTDDQYVRLQVENSGPSVENSGPSVENSGPSKGRATPFMPQSLSERAAALGGYVTVDRHRDGRSLVEITIPR